MLAALVVVCLLAYFVLRFGLRRLAGPRAGPQSIEILERCPLGSGKALWIVRIGTRRFVIGAAEQSLVMLAELDLEDVEVLSKEGPVPQTRFVDVLGRMPRPDGCQGKDVSKGPEEAFDE